MSRATQEQPKRYFYFKYEAVTLYGVSFQTSSSIKILFYFFPLKDMVVRTPSLMLFKEWVSF